MKKIILIAIIGSNNVYSCPLYTNHREFDQYMKNYTADGISVIAKSDYDRLPSKSPPFPCRTTYIISTEYIDAEKATNTTIVNSLEELFDTVPDEETVFIFLTAAWREELLSTPYKNRLNAIVVAQSNRTFIGTEVFKVLPVLPVEWSPLLITNEQDHPDFTVHRYSLLL
jgi:hypothetical protein